MGGEPVRKTSPRAAKFRYQTVLFRQFPLFSLDSLGVLFESLIFLIESLFHPRHSALYIFEFGQDVVLDLHAPVGFSVRRAEKDG
uniref:Uncharacterized protein n=1 Tax=Candidatus Kentrum sp. TC TaxID=2126339 RepID=A0A451A8M4_9GAMM|nr:MAG: hypothetical protein BECKTC1821F_GA0114240_107316 [Candidatus Kentron sp. TC]